MEIDFILNETTAYEVKETPTHQHLHKCQYNAGCIGITDARLAGRYPHPQFSTFTWGGNIF